MCTDPCSPAVFVRSFVNSPTAPRLNEMEKYLAEVNKLDNRVDLLGWWRTIGSVKYPRVARMARQYLGTPATSAGVERLFSKCGRAYANLAQSTKDSTLEARMFAGINIDKWVDESSDECSDDEYN